MQMKKSLVMIFAIIGLSGAMALGSTVSTTPIQPLYSSLEEQEDDDPQEEPANDQATNDEPVEEPEPEPEPMDELGPTLEPVTKPLGDADSSDFDDGGSIEREKECPKGEYDNGGKCTKIPQCTPPE